jgi:hypothetical protein
MSVSMTSPVESIRERLWEYIVVSRNTPSSSIHKRRNGMDGSMLSEYW